LSLQEVIEKGEMRYIKFFHESWENYINGKKSTLQVCRKLLYLNLLYLDLLCFLKFIMLVKLAKNFT